MPKINVFARYRMMQSVKLHVLRLQNISYFFFVITQRIIYLNDLFIK